jgi:hypothetical protein
MLNFQQAGPERGKGVSLVVGRSSAAAEDVGVVWGLRRGNRCGGVGNADLARFLDDFKGRVVVDPAELMGESDIGGNFSRSCY